MGEKSDGQTLGYRFDKKIWRNNPAGLFVALKVFMYMFIYISLVCG